MTEQSSQTVVLTGAAGGMGRAITKALIDSGRRVVLVDRDARALRELAATAGDKVFPIELDISDAKAVDRLPDAIPNHFRPVGVLINNAGHDIGGRTRFDIGSADDWSNIIQTNLIGLMRVTRAILPGMVQRDAGHIVNISSINAVRIVPDMAAYSASKAGVHMFTETLRGELAETAIRVTELQPGLTRTNIILTRYRGDTQKEKDYFDQFRMALDPADIARSIVFALDQPAHVQIAEMMILPVNRY
ncbi:3-hydroxy acid dehydrogenase/malonic semialdehyde reductase [Bradyrhizobium sp. R2.2-H]|jgi:3-hydroxy acid dehydrogenase/malonic semialdehyde reductase|uniref:SDR family oxidoreductase n=1 Tax=unclassified Bradyrhizobium TaxID=2631580 RepID=UPI00104F57A0|nr:MULTISPECIES: SDR family oxidoreductase [unclassified Bradyrhizobium]TCU69311.1 3-hydroxy acid dehydrogenase/malonic semialdehyde reductase [Bradyrhizobium sp. Y-H1]TCU70803.1 3-hydroxy acid dehydrogenase/malonic semialdehyde reductase [Bradyrhizobium sp. R2.2-H]